MSFWAEVRNNFFEDYIAPIEGDVLARVSIDAWKSDNSMEEGQVLASVLLSKHGDVLVDYRDSIARTDEKAQAAIQEAICQLKDHFQELQISEKKELPVNHVILVRERHSGSEKWFDKFWVDVSKKPSVETFKKVVEEYLRSDNGKQDLDDLNYRFTWGDASMFIPYEFWKEHGIYHDDATCLPKNLGLIPTDNRFSCIIDQDENLIPLDILHQIMYDEKSSVQIVNYDDAIKHLCNVFNDLQKSQDSEQHGTLLQWEDVVPLFKTTNYFGLYCFHGGENQYYLLNRNTGEHEMVLGDSFEFVGKNSLDCLKDEEVLHVFNKEFTKYLVDFSYDNVKGVFPLEKMYGIAVLESGLRSAEEKEGHYFPKPSLMDQIKNASKRSRSTHQRNGAEKNNRFL